MKTETPIESVTTNPLILAMNEAGIELYPRITIDQLRKRLITAIEHNGLSESTLREQTHRGLFRKVKDEFVIDVEGVPYNVSIEQNNEDQRITILYSSKVTSSTYPVYIYYAIEKIDFRWKRCNTVYYGEGVDYVTNQSIENTFVGYVLDMLKTVVGNKDLELNMKENKKDYNHFLKEIAQIRNNATVEA